MTLLRCLCNICLSVFNLVVLPLVALEKLFHGWPFCHFSKRYFQDRVFPKQRSVVGYLFRILYLVSVTYYFCIILNNVLSVQCFLIIALIFFKYDLSIGPFPSKNRSSCSCNGFSILAQNVQVDEMEDLQRRRSEEYQKYQLRSKVHSSSCPLIHFGLA